MILIFFISIKKKVTLITQRIFKWLRTLPTSAVLVPIQGLSLVLWWIAGSYFEKDTFASRSFPGEDGWCNPENQGLGVHCWGDYYNPVIWLNNYRWSGEPQAHPASSMFPFHIANELGSVIGDARAGLLVYLIAMVSLISLSTWLATRGLPFEKRLILFTSLTLLSPPLVSAIDRGNSIGFLVPLMVLFFWALGTNKSNIGVLAVILMSLIKPHFTLVLYLYLIKGRVKTFLIGVVSLAVLHTLAFIVLDTQGFPRNILYWFSALNSHQDPSPLSRMWPQNISFSQGMYSLVYSLDRLFKTDAKPVLEYIEINKYQIGPMILIFAVILISVFRNRLSDRQTAIILISTVSMVSAVSWYYYAIFAIPSLLALANPKYRQIISKSRRSTKSQPSVSSNIDVVLWMALILTLIQIPLFGVPRGEPNFYPDLAIAVTSSTMIGIVWVSALVWIFGYLFKEAITPIVSGKKTSPSISE
jgi:hypothetical protein